MSVNAVIFSVDHVLWDAQAVYQQLDANEAKVIGKKHPMEIFKRHQPEILFDVQAELGLHDRSIGYVSQQSASRLRELFKQRVGILQTWQRYLTRDQMLENDFGWFAGSPWLYSADGMVGGDAAPMTLSDQLQALQDKLNVDPAAILGVTADPAELAVFTAQGMQAVLVGWGPQAHSDGMSQTALVDLILA